MLRNICFVNKLFKFVKIVITNFYTYIFLRKAIHCLSHHFSQRVRNSSTPMFNFAYENICASGFAYLHLKFVFTQFDTQPGDGIFLMFCFSISNPLAFYFMLCTYIYICHLYIYILFTYILYTYDLCWLVIHFFKEGIFSMLLIYMYVYKHLFFKMKNETTFSVPFH